ncbi:hypothetical protein ACI77O_12860 [Pseudomonas tritici]|uniref:hypothetical protein n=1 Tax=Pseudomonas tritici TaxID=2745518 RepID=UPI00387AB698
MSNFDFGQLVLTSSAPSLEARELALRNAMDMMHVCVGYLRVHSLKVVSATSFYAAVSYSAGAGSSERYLTYVAGTLRCTQKNEGYWLKAECFLATASVPFNLQDCPPQVFEAGAATTYQPKVNSEWFEGCRQQQKESVNREALRKGAVFKLDPNSTSVVVQGEFATYAIVLNKRTARYIEPIRGVSTEAPIDTLITSFSPVAEGSAPVMSVKSEYKQAGGLLFDRKGSLPILKGRIAFQSEEMKLSISRRRIETALKSSCSIPDFTSHFQTACWFS